MYFIIEEAEETVLDFYKELWECYEYRRTT